MQQGPTIVEFGSNRPFLLSEVIITVRKRALLCHTRAAVYTDCISFDSSAHER